jgi:hypothetical protein
VGGKTATSTQQVAVPPQVLAQYSSVVAGANQTAQTPFSDYGGQFVAPVNAEQSSGIAGTNAAADEAQPYYGAATNTLGTAQAGTTPVNEAAEYGTAASSAPISGQQINQYLSPYLGDVLGSTEQIQNQENQQAQAGQLGNAITSGAFGGDRTGIAAANLQQQEDLANSNVISGIANTGYQSALGTATTEQGIGLQGANQLASIGSTAYGEGANTASELGTLGTGAQTAGLSGAQAQIAAGTVQQQTQQAQDTAEYNQFLQEQSYPFQVGSWLAGISEGTGALSGSTTTTQQPGGFFSDERLKEDMEPVGKTFDGQTIYRYKIKGDPRDRIGLSAQKVEKKHPDAVGLAGGFRFVDYGKATEKAANRGHFYTGGIAGRSVSERAGFAYGGVPDGGLDSVLQAQQTMYAQHPQQQRNIGGQGNGSPQLAVASGSPPPPASGSSKAQQTIGLGKDAYQAYKYFNKPANNGVAGTPTNTAGAPAPSTTSNGVTTNFEPQPPGTTTTFTDPSAGLNTGAAPEVATPGADASGLGAADTAAASDAGATGAADVAGTAGAEAAGAGAAEAGAGAAAGTAAGAAAGAGAADAAAAIAAEYAAADVATVAVLAAKRGGKISRRGYDTGGSPYSDPDGAYDIPATQQSDDHLQSPGPLVKQPTGLQTAMKMGQPDEASNLSGEMFSNQALARGGVAGRRGYDDGGDVTPDPDVSPQIATDADRGAGIVAPSSSDSGSLWDTVKKHATAENVIPILSGLAAMGTARTRSPGVALAAGLGAGSQSYLDTRRSLADTAEEQQKVQAAQIANQLSALKLGVAQNALAPQSNAGVPRQAPATAPQQMPAQTASPAQTSPADAAQTAAGLAAQYRNQFFVNTARTPEEQAAKDSAIKKDWAVGGTMFQTQADNDYQARVQRDQQTARNTAQQLADTRYAQYNDPGASPADKQIALAHYNAVRQWTGDDPKLEGGVVKNSRTNLPEIGAIAQQGFTPEQQAVNMAKAQELVNVPNNDGTLTQMPAWQAHHAQSPQAYAQSLMPNSTALSPNIPTRPTAAPAVGTASPSVQRGTTQSPIALEQQRLNLAAVEQARAVGDQAPNNRSINQQLLQLSSGTQTGPLTATLQKLAGAAGLPSGSRYQEINAYLDRQAATQASAMGVPHTNAGLAASQTATGTTEYTPQALQEKVKYADALNSGTMAYREGLDKAVGTGATQNLQKYQPFRSAWAKNFDPDIYRAEDAQRRGDTAELNAIRTRLGSRGMKVLAQKSANLRALENGQIPP